MRYWKIIVGAVLGSIVIVVLTMGVLYLVNPQAVRRIFVKVAPAVFVDHLHGVTYSNLKYDGIDVSKHNGVIKWKQVATNNNLKLKI